MRNSCPTRAAIAWVLGLALACSGCGTPEGGYLGNRLADLTDVAYVELSMGSFGALANVGPLLLGYLEHPGIVDVGAPRTRLGLGGRGRERDFALASHPNTAWGLVVPLKHAYLTPRPWCARYNIWPPPGSAGVHFGYVLGLGLAVDAVEFVDFVLGFTTFDLLLDDLPGPERPPSQRPTPVDLPSPAPEGVPLSGPVLKGLASGSDPHS